jgi:hypothetical protein
MTETDSRRPSSTKRKAAGLKIERIFTTEGTHPYDEVTWERRDVLQQNWKTGETVFEQRGVEFPDFWSVNASTIVTTKYFRGAVGTDAREWSLKQLIDRVVTTYRLDLHDRRRQVHRPTHLRRQLAHRQLPRRDQLRVTPPCPASSSPAPLKGSAGPPRPPCSTMVTGSSSMPATPTARPR